MDYTEEEVAEIRSKIVSNAKQLLNVPFVHRGRTRFGLDCLGLGVLAYRRSGAYLPDGRYAPDLL
jgi:cell wall-associated NlpC family hydrolase